jgi:hypothetical protein
VESIVDCIFVLEVFNFTLARGRNVNLIWFFNLQSEHDELETKYFEERAQLQAKYQKLYEPLYTKVSVRYLLVMIQLLGF